MFSDINVSQGTGSITTYAGSGMISINQSINQSIFICSKCPEIHIKGFSIASRTTRLRPALTAAQLINYTMKEKEKLNAYKIAYGGVHIHCTRFYLKLITVTKIR